MSRKTVDDPQTKSEYARRAARIRVPTIRKLNSCIEDCMGIFETALAAYSGVFFEEGDENDVITSRIQRDILDLRTECDEATRRNILTKIIGNVPLPVFLPAVKKRNRIVTDFGDVEQNVQVSTSARQKYEAICTYAFGPEHSLQSLRYGKSDSGWNWKAELYSTASTDRTWELLEYTKSEFDKWWERLRAKSEVSECCADLKALCKAVVFLSDDVSYENLNKLSCADRLKELVQDCQKIAYLLVHQMSLHPEYVKGISGAFGFVVPIMYAASIVTRKASCLISEPTAIVRIQERHLSERLSELEFLVSSIKDIIEAFGARLIYRPLVHATREDIKNQTCVGQPTVAQLFNLVPEELPRKYVDIMVDSGLAKNKESLQNEMNRIHSDKMQLVVQQIAGNFCENEQDGSDLNYDITELEEHGIGKIHVSERPVSFLGAGATSTVSLYRSPRDGSKVYAVKYSKYINEAAWNRIKHEALIWKKLNHSNILPLLGYCILTGQGSTDNQGRAFPSLVTPYCSGGCLDDYLQEHRRSITYHDKMKFLYDIISALSYLHSESICHGDLRAANVLVNETPEGPHAMICDFGLSDFFQEVVNRLHKPTEEQQAHDKWLAPELMFARPGTIARVSDKGDIFAFGCVILEVAFSKKPYESWPDHEVIDAKRRQELPATQSDMDEFYWAIAKDCWGFQARDRPKTDAIVSRIAERLHIEAL
ncbi:hypothetical protein ACEPAF_123 [Sanghuangporus sanghuang]